MYLTLEKRIEFVQEEIDDIIEEKAETAAFLCGGLNPAQHTIFTNKYVYAEVRITNLKKRLQDLKNELENAV